MRERGNLLARRLDYCLGIPLANMCGLLRRFGGKKDLQARHTGVLCFGAIGDLLLLSALVRGIRAQCPESRITLITSTANAAAVPLLDGVDAHNAFPATDIPGIIGCLRRNAFDILFDSTQWARMGALVSALSGARVTVGFATPGQYRGGGYDVRVPHRNDVHETENFLSLGRALWPEMQGRPALRLSSCTATPLPAGLTENSYVVLHMWASGIHKEIKEWPAAHWAELGRRLRDAGYTVVFSGGNGDAPATENFLKTWFPRERDGIISLAGKTSLETLAGLLRRARAVVSVNTGVMHLAALCDAPTIGLHGATNPLRWGPIGAQTCSLLPHAGDMAYLNLGFEYPSGVRSSLPHLPVEDVLAALRQWSVLA